MAEYWGYELLLDCGDCDRAAVSSGEAILAFLSELIMAIDMNAYGEPQLEHFGKHDENLSGYTLTQLIETSSITGHFVDKTGAAYLNVHSCKPFEPEVVKEVVRKHFRPGRMKDTFILRLA
jgi:S-adenosylmethionine/arginine decarboxylase-like enzyme